MNTPKSTILAVDDAEDVRNLLEATLGREHVVRTAGDAAAALRLALEPPLPDLALLDVEMPGASGFDLCKTFKATPALADVPVIFLTSRADAEDVVHGFAIGAIDYVPKPIVPAALAARVAVHLELIARRNRQDEMVRSRTIQLEETRQSLIRRLGRAMEFHESSAVGNRVVRLAHYARALAEAAGARQLACDLLMKAAPLHDIGKLGVPAEVLRKQGALSAPEREQVARHPAIGADIIGQHDDPLLKLARTLALTHHEHWDGKGYPAGLKANDIPWAGRLMAIVDAFESMTATQFHRASMPIERAAGEIERGAGTQFDPQMVAAFGRALPALRKVHETYGDQLGDMLNLDFVRPAGAAAAPAIADEQRAAADAMRQADARRARMLAEARTRLEAERNASGQLTPRAQAETAQNLEELQRTQQMLTQLRAQAEEAAQRRKDEEQAGAQAAQERKQEEIALHELQRQRADAEHVLSELEGMRKSLSDLEQRRVAAESALAELEMWRAAAEGAAQKLHDAEQAAARAAEERRREEAALDELQRQRTDIERSLAELETKRRAAQEDLRAQVEQAAAEAERMRQSLAELEKRHAAVESVLLDADVKRAALEKATQERAQEEEVAAQAIRERQAELERLQQALAEAHQVAARKHEQEEQAAAKAAEERRQARARALAEVEQQRSAALADLEARRAAAEEAVQKRVQQEQAAAKAVEERKRAEEALVELQAQKALAEAMLERPELRGPQEVLAEAERQRAAAELALSEATTERRAAEEARAWAAEEAASARMHRTARRGLALFAFLLGGVAAAATVYFAFPRTEVVVRQPPKPVAPPPPAPEPGPLFDGAPLELRLEHGLRSAPAAR